MRNWPGESGRVGEGGWEGGDGVDVSQHEKEEIKEERLKKKERRIHNIYIICIYKT